MDLFTAQLLLTMLAVLSSGRAATILHSYLDHHLNDTAISHTSVVNKKCDCRLLCMEDETCRAVTATGTEERVTCAFSNTPQPGMTSAVTGAITYVKSVPCEAPYELVEGVGCLWFSDFSATIRTAKTSCPKNAGVTGLVSPATDHIYWKMIEYISAKGLVPPQRFWIGLERIDQVWVWRDGHTLPSTPGVSVWTIGEPNDDTACANILYDPVYGFHYGLVDTLSCSSELLFICEMR